MAAASGGLLFINGLGAMTGPLDDRRGDDPLRAPTPSSPTSASLFALIALYALYRVDRRAAPPARPRSYAPVLPQASPVALEVAQEVAIERAGEAGGGAGEAASLLLRGRRDCPANEEASMDRDGAAGDSRLLAGRGRRRRLVPRPTRRSTQAIREPLGRALGEGRSRRARRLALQRRARPGAPRSCSTSSRATCSAATPRAFASDARALAGRQGRDPARARPAGRAARAAVLLPAADAFGDR